MQISELSPTDRSKEEAGGSDEHLPFEISLKELKDLRSQLLYAADYCETTFVKSQNKKAVVENTKEYICRAVVTLVDHLGNVSANLNHCVAKTDEFSKVERRMDCLKQDIHWNSNYLSHFCVPFAVLYMLIKTTSFDRDCNHARYILRKRL